VLTGAGGRVVEEGMLPADDYCAEAGRLDAAGWVLDALDPGDDERFTAHLFSCRGCRLMVEDLEVAARILLTSGSPEPPARLEFAVLDRVRQAARRPRPSGW
jgi:hypothetical protein